MTLESTTEIDLTSVPGAPSGSRSLRGHLSRPEGDGPWPAVVVVHEALEIDDVMLRQVDRLARAGFLALMPDLFSDGGVRRCLVSTFRSVFSGRGRAYADLETARAYLATHPDATGAVGIIGFCMGGGFALVCATRGFDAASANYGVLPRDLDALADACPVIGSYGGRDKALGAKAVTRLDEALTRHGVEHEVTLYPDAGHSFLNDAPNGPRWMGPIARVTGMGPEPASAAEAWERIDAFLTHHLSHPRPRQDPDPAEAS